MSRDLKPKLGAPIQRTAASRPPYVRQGGMSIIAGIFLLLLMAGLAALMASFTTVQNTTSAQDVLGAQAYQAARAGIEWGVYRVTQGGGVCTGNTPLPALADELAQFTVVVDCSPTTFIETATPKNFYRITSTASSGVLGRPHYVERQLVVTLSP